MKSKAEQVKKHMWYSAKQHLIENILGWEESDLWKRSRDVGVTSATDSYDFHLRNPHPVYDDYIYKGHGYFDMRDDGTERKIKKRGQLDGRHLVTSKVFYNAVCDIQFSISYWGELQGYDGEQNILLHRAKWGDIDIYIEAPEKKHLWSWFLREGEFRDIYAIFINGREVHIAGIPAWYQAYKYIRRLLFWNRKFQSVRAGFNKVLSIIKPYQ